MRLKKRDSGRWPHLIESFAIAVSMYSRIPMPKVEWSDSAMRYALCFFPVVGAAVGAAVTAFSFLADVVGLGALARACIGTALPLLITGGIHMDGFLDTLDARSSLSDRGQKLEILKDPHTGAFATLGCGVYLLLYAAAFSELGSRAFPAVCGIYVMSRALSAFSVLAFPKVKKEGLARAFADGAGEKNKVAPAALLGWFAAGAFWLWLFGGAPAAAAVTVTSLAGFAWYYRMAMREFGGITGDLAGFFLQAAELIMLVALAVTTR